MRWCKCGITSPWLESWTEPKGDGAQRSSCLCFLVGDSGLLCLWLLMPWGPKALGAVSQNKPFIPSAVSVGHLITEWREIISCCLISFCSHFVGNVFFLLKIFSSLLFCVMNSHSWRVGKLYDKPTLSSYLFSYNPWAKNTFTFFNFKEKSQE